MKSRGLLSVLTFSEKRKGILFLLEEKPRTLSEIREHFNVSSPEISPRIKEMQTSNLIRKDEKRYHITPMGKAIASHYRPLLDILATIEKNESFWNEHTVEDIPPHLLEDLAQIRGCEVISDSIENIYESHKIFADNISKSNYVKGISPIFIPTYPDFFTSLAENHVPTSLILTENVFFKVATEHRGKLQFFLDSPKSELYVINDVKLAFVVTDYFFSLSLFYENGSYDPRSDLVGYDESSIKWGEEIFEYYRRRSRRIVSL
ncbi:winged helix-turn-helix domain-containing protein [Methanolobus sp. ZRKC3]|uniref:helix-turn-helix transcriptional regulator n=1 Tax=Methanolobus sp. ZRKC3 TaxID=3125786 RepID=UPI003251DAD4